MILNGIMHEVGPGMYENNFLVNHANEFSFVGNNFLIKGYSTYDKYDLEWKQIKIGPLCLVEWSN